MEKTFEIPKNCKGFTVKALENGDFEVIYNVDSKERVNKSESYYYINSSGEVTKDQEDFLEPDTFRFSFGNYFFTARQARKALGYVQAAFDKFWEDETKSSSN